MQARKVKENMRKANYLVECSVDGVQDGFQLKREARRDFDASVAEVKARGYGYVLFVNKDGEEIDFFSLKARR